MSERIRSIACHMLREARAPDGVLASVWRDRWPRTTFLRARGALRQAGAPLVYTHKTRRWTLAEAWTPPPSMIPRVVMLDLELDALIGPVPS